jgi:hypothetical protein
VDQGVLRGLGDQAALEHHLNQQGQQGLEVLRHHLNQQDQAVLGVRAALLQVQQGLEAPSALLVRYLHLNRAVLGVLEAPSALCLLVPQQALEARVARLQARGVPEALGVRVVLELLQDFEMLY